MTSTPERTPAEELRAAAELLRCDHDFHFTKRGCSRCGVDTRPVIDELVEPLAAWLGAARQLTRTHPTNPAYEAANGLRWCEECNNEECEALGLVTHALSVARVINGGAP